ncbi:hypothetical protein K505DRAFT_355963 [Melanomma pulvis-pyrius CBS 109.77]|uniref:Uncharacterized protein n=1 Tax=Melanomma pulvis-pyrius CBS 109.77 TaxID=1314802 RepID=A0A6A6XUU2_9PLEO|nr:hypothetical protein K505DRAFT_355963 [Melanomma pulvis-pyrius CBS 109.77]
MNPSSFPSLEGRRSSTTTLSFDEALDKARAANRKLAQTHFGLLNSILRGNVDSMSPPANPSASAPLSSEIPEPDITTLPVREAEKEAKQEAKGKRQREDAKSALLENVMEYEERHKTSLPYLRQKARISQSFRIGANESNTHDEHLSWPGKLDVDAVTNEVGTSATGTSPSMSSTRLIQPTLHLVCSKPHPGPVAEELRPRRKRIGVTDLGKSKLSSLPLPRTAEIDQQPPTSKAEPRSMHRRRGAIDLGRPKSCSSILPHPPLSSPEHMAQIYQESHTPAQAAAVITNRAGHSHVSRVPRTKIKENKKLDERVTISTKTASVFPRRNHFTLRFPLSDASTTAQSPSSPSLDATDDQLSDVPLESSEPSDEEWDKISQDEREEIEWEIVAKNRV